MRPAAWRRKRGTSWLLAVGLIGCDDSSFELASGDGDTHGQVETTPEVEDRLPKDETSSPETSDRVPKDETSNRETADRPRPPTDIPTVRLPNPPIVLPPQVVYDLPAAQTLTDRPHWRWIATQPSLSKSRFIPSDTDPAPTMELNVAGDWVFELRAWEDAESLAEIVWTQTISVISGQGLHIELLWDTPGDEDQTDEGTELGTDLDLHFVHLEYAVGADFDGDGDGVDDPWFHQLFDTFWFTPNPNWGTLDSTADDNPSLDRDDTDGAGPENLSLTLGTNGLAYGIGVHYWTDHGFGVSTATVRIYWDGALVEQHSQLMTERDLWYVGTIDWAAELFTLKVDAAGAHYVAPGYAHPNFDISE